MKTTAAVLRAPDAPFTIEDVQLRGLGENEVLVQIVAAGMCPTDFVARRPPFTADGPIIVGHEGAGIVVDTGSSVDRVRRGDRVVITYNFCGVCPRCRAGDVGACARLIDVNIGAALGDASATGSDGEPISARWFGQSSFSSHVIAAEDAVVVIDDDVPFEIVAPFGCGFTAGAASILVALSVTADTSLIVFGAGAVGLAAVMAARSVGARRIVAVDRDEGRLNLARELGASEIVRADGFPIRSVLLGLEPYGFDVAFDTTGAGAVLLDAIATVRVGGTVGTVGVQHDELVLRDNALDGKTLTSILGGGVTAREMIPRLVGMWRDGDLPVEKLITYFPLHHINEAEHASRSGTAVKPVLTFDTKVRDNTQVESERDDMRIRDDVGA